MKTALKILTLIAFIALVVYRTQGAQPAKPHGNTTVIPELSHGITIELPAQNKTTYYVKVGNTISQLVDKNGYIIAAKRFGMETILIIPDGKVYRTVSLDLKKDDEALKDAIEVKVDEIIVV